MIVKITTAPLQGLLIIEPQVFTDHRGHFFEAFQSKRYAEAGMPSFVQENVSWSKRDVLRGLHYQSPQFQGKLVWVTRGTVWDVAVDIRLSSPTFGQWFGISLSAENNTQLYVPPGFAHGFCVLSEDAIFHYQCTDFYMPGSEYGIAWNDSRLNIPWPVKNPILSSKDESYPALHEIVHERLFI